MANNNQDKPESTGPQSPYSGFDTDAPKENRKPHKALARRRRWKKFRWLVWLVLMVPVLYFVIQMFIVLAPRMRTDVAMLYTMTDSLNVTGQVVLDSMPVTASGGGHPYYTTPNGQRVGAEAEVALLFSSEQGVEAMDRLTQIDKEIELLNLARTTVTEGGDMEKLLGERQTGLYGMLEAIENYDYGQIDGYENEVALASNRIQIATGTAVDFDSRIAQLEAAKEQLQGVCQPMGTVVAPEVGYFVASPLNDRVVLDYDTILTLSPSQLYGILNAPATFHGSEVMGHLVQDYTWHFFTAVSLADAGKFVVGDKSLHLAFPGVGNISVPVQVQSVVEDEDAGLATIELYCEYLTPAVLDLRIENARIVFGEQKGIRIEKNALRLVDIKNEDGSVNTYRGVYERIGNMVYFRRVDILLEDEYFYLIPNQYVAGVNELEMYDIYVVDPGGVELYDQKIL